MPTAFGHHLSTRTARACIGFAHRHLLVNVRESCLVLHAESSPTRQSSDIKVTHFWGFLDLLIRFEHIFLFKFLIFGRSPSTPNFNGFTTKSRVRRARLLKKLACSSSSPEMELESVCGA